MTLDEAYRYIRRVRRAAVKDWHRSGARLVLGSTKIGTPEEKRMRDAYVSGYVETHLAIVLTKMPAEIIQRVSL